MTSKDFAYWLQGFFELSDANTPLTEKQVQTIKNHLKLVFLHEIDPSYSDNKIVQQIFQNIHDGKQPLADVTIESNVKPVKQPIQYGSSDVKIKC
jgi:hypothetical protein